MIPAPAYIRHIKMYINRYKLKKICFNLVIQLLFSIEINKHVCTCTIFLTCVLICLRGMEINHNMQIYPQDVRWRHKLQATIL